MKTSWRKQMALSAGVRHVVILDNMVKVEILTGQRYELESGAADDL